MSLNVAQGRHPSAFGAWRMHEVAVRQVRAMRDGTPMHIPLGKRVRFSVGAVLAQAAHRPDLTPETAARRKGAARRARTSRPSANPGKSPGRQEQYLASCKNYLYTGITTE